MFTLDEYTPRFSGYRSLMQKRVKEILLVSSIYDAFVLEEDGSISEQIWSQYAGMRLTEPPAVTRASSSIKALKMIKEGRFDMVLAMTRLYDGDPFELAREIKKIRKDLPVFLLATDPAELTELPIFPERTGIDRVFLWNNNPLILLAIIKLVEDGFNIETDIINGKVRVVILVEDSAVHYSAFLPIIYTVVMQLTRSLIDSGLNDLHKQLRMRSRAKILLAESYEEATELYQKYQDSVLGIISDVKYWKNGQQDRKAGVEFAKAVRAQTPLMPFLLQSTNADNRNLAYSIGARFLDKTSLSLLSDFKKFLKEEMGFGDFVFRMPDTSEITRASDVFEFVEKIKEIPIESVIWHAQYNHFSNWLMARTEVTIADQLRPKKVSDYETHEEVRQYLVDLVTSCLVEKQSDVVASFSMKRAMNTASFETLGQGSMGGKGRGIAFVRYVNKKIQTWKSYPNIKISVPPTLVVGSGEFTTFLEDNNLHTFAIACDDYEEIKKRFLDGFIRLDLARSLRHYLRRVKKPVAIRSSSLLEDSHRQPFAGLYSTYMLPNNEESDEKRLKRLLEAIKMVWASTFGPDPKSYFKATSHRIEEEQMGVIIQEVVGQEHGDYYYPTFSGVGQSYNFYPFGKIKPEDGVAHLALGLGKMVVEGGKVLRFSPSMPKVLPQFGSPEDWLNMSQKQFYALKMHDKDINIFDDPEEGLDRLELSVAESDGELAKIGSVYHAENRVIRDSMSYPGPRLVSFASVLKYNEFPLAELLTQAFDIFSKAMGCPIEMEFAVNIKEKEPSEFMVLQLRPLIAKNERMLVDIAEDDIKQAWCYSTKALGNGCFDTIQDVVYVKRENFDKARMQEMPAQIGELNAKLEAENRDYMLIGFGRWGSSDPWLGIGVGWSQISGAKIMVEASHPDLIVDPSHGTHFFQNITSLGIGYLTIDEKKSDSFLDFEFLKQLEIIEETEHLRHVRFPYPIKLKIDGRNGKAVVMNTEADCDENSSGNIIELS